MEVGRRRWRACLEALEDAGWARGERVRSDSVSDAEDEEDEQDGVDCLCVLSVGRRRKQIRDIAYQSYDHQHVVHFEFSGDPGRGIASQCNEKRIDSHKCGRHPNCKGTFTSRMIC
jgi:hypothetical protein